MIQTSVKSSNRLFDLLKRAPLEDLQELFKRYDVTYSPELVRSDPDRPILNLLLAIREAGSNSFWTWVGYDPKNYDEIVLDVAEKMNVNIEDTSVKDELGLELLILQHVFKEYFDKLSPEERQNMEKELARLGMKMVDFEQLFVKAGAGVIVNILAQINGRLLWQVLSGILRTVMARYAAGAAAYRAIGWFWYAVPYLNAALAASLVWDLLGPAYRHTIPTVVEVALLRLQFADSQPSDSRNAYHCSVCGHDSGLNFSNGKWYCSVCLPD